jgi:nitroreductase
VEFQDVLSKRQSVRDFDDRAVPDDKLKIVLEAARISQSGGNRQQWKFIVVKDPEKRRLLMEAANGQVHIGAAPVIIAAVGLNPTRMMLCDVPSYAMDLGIAVENMALAAVDQGLGTCWIGAFIQDRVRYILGVPETYKVGALLPMGYAKQVRASSSRKSFEEVVCWESFKE